MELNCGADTEVALLLLGDHPVNRRWLAQRDPLERLGLLIQGAQNRSDLR